MENYISILLTELKDAIARQAFLLAKEIYR